ncbi:MAG: FG-GAP repeat domain-containing protein, partial [Geodermatophilaceae bacterium]
MADGAIEDAFGWHVSAQRLGSGPQQCTEKCHQQPNMALFGPLHPAVNQAGSEFAPPTAYPTANGPVSVTAADFSGDGKPDLAELLAA